MPQKNRYIRDEMHACVPWQIQQVSHAFLPLDQGKS
jgi:hypothetical protein